MAEFKKTEVVAYPRVGQKITADTLYWKNYDFPIAVKDYGPIDYIDFSTEEPYYFAVSCSSRVQIYSPTNNEVCRSLSRFKHAAYGGSFRNDGKLVVAGSEDGSIQIYEAKSKSLLRIFKGHTAATHRCKFMIDGVRVATFSDDKSVGLWDVPTETRLVSLQEHEDYIRAGAVSKASADIFVSGSYDHTVKMYDARTSKRILSVDHGVPVESVLMFPSGNVFLSAGGTVIKVWDAVAGRLLASLSHHHKTITCLHFASENKRIMSGSLDRHVKIYDSMTYQVVHTLDCSSPILSLAISPQDKIITAGMTSGLLSISHRKNSEEVREKSSKKRRKILIDYNTPSTQFYPIEDDIVIIQDDVKSLPKHDRYLRTFQHTRTLDDALNTNKPEVIVSIIQELIRRGAIKAAIAGRDEKSLTGLMKFLIMNIGDSRFSRTLLDVSLVLVDVYGSRLKEYPFVISLFQKLKVKIDRELSYIEEMMEVLGAINCIIKSTNQYG